MSSSRRNEPSYVLTTRVERLLRDWQRQLPAPEFPFEDEADLRRELKLPGPRVWVCDAGDERIAWECHPDTVRIVVGQPQSIPFETLRQNDPRAYFLSYVESQTRLDAALKSAATLAEQNAVITLLRTRGSRPDRPSFAGAAPAPAGPDKGEDWMFLESALANLDNREALLADFQRLVRSRLESMRALVFLREGAEFRSAAADAAIPCPISSPLTGWLEERAAMLDIDAWDGDTDPMVEVEVRRRMNQWRVRLLIPFLVRSRLHGWLCVGVRADGSAHNDQSRVRALAMARMFESLLDRHERAKTQLRLEETQREFRTHLPAARIVTASQALSEDLPTVVRAVVGDAFHTGKLAVHEPQSGSPLRVAATPIPGDKVAVSWMDCSALLSQSEEARHVSRLSALTEVGLLIQHQLGNALQIASSVQEMLASGVVPPEPVTARFGKDLERLVKFQRLLGALNSAAAATPQYVDCRAIADELRTSLGVRVSAADPTPVVLADRRTLIDALVALVSAVSQPAGQGAELATSLEIVRRGEGDAELALIYVRSLHGTPAGLVGSPTGQHADLEVFVAREIIERQGGTVEVAQGMRGPELHISLGRSQPIGRKPTLPGVSRLPVQPASSPWQAVASSTG